MGLQGIFEFECMPGSNSCSAGFLRSDSLGPPPFHISSTFAKAWNCYPFAKGDSVFSNSPDELAALLSRHAT
jgi:hypothetical protein